MKDITNKHIQTSYKTTLNIIQQTNQIIRNWKNGYIESANKLVPELNIPRDLATASYAEILSTVNFEFKRFMDMTGDNTYADIARRFGSMMVIHNINQTIGGFDKNPEVYKLYKSIFGKVSNMADQFMMQNIDIDRDASEKDAFLITPSIPPLGIDKPVGMQPIQHVPEFLEVFFVSDDKNGHQIEDVMYVRDMRGFTFKAVPELPKNMLEFAIAKNIPGINR